MRVNPALIEPRRWARRYAVVIAFPIALVWSVSKTLAREMRAAFHHAWLAAKGEIQQAKEWWK